MATLDEISGAFYSYSYTKYEEELKNSDKPEEKSFPSKSAFQENFQTKVNTVYNELNKNYPPEQANYIYKTLVANLEKQSENPGQSRIIDSSKGTINVENLNSYSKKVEETLKTRHPERFEVKDSNLENKTLTNDIKKTVDFNNPEDRTAYLENILNEYSNLKTEEEKRKYIEENYVIDPKDEEDTKKAFEFIDKVNEVKKENPEMDTKECLQETMSRESITKDEVDYKLKLIRLGEVNKEFKILEEQGKQGSPEWIRLEEEKRELNAEINEYRLKQKVNESNENIEEQENNDLEDSLNSNIKEQQENDDLEELLNADVEEEQENDDLEDILNAETEEEQENDDLEDILNAETEEEQENDDLEDILNADVEEEQDKKNQEKQVYNSIMMGSGVENDKIEENELTQEDYVYDVEEKETLWDKIKNGFSKIKDGILKVINPNKKAKELNGVKAIDTAKNNTQNDLDNYVKFDISLDAQKAYAKSLENSTNKEKSSIEVDRGDSLNLG